MEKIVLKTLLVVTLTITLSGAGSAQAVSPLADGFDYPIGASPPGRVTAAEDSIDTWRRIQDYKAPNAEVTARAESRGITIPAGRTLRHAGEDWARNSANGSSVGRSVFAIGTGEVTGVRAIVEPGSNTASGSVIVVQHNLPESAGIAGNTLSSVYLHVDPVSAIQVGEQISRGQLLGVITDLGATPAHLHFEVRTGAIDASDLWPNDTFFGYYLDDADFDADNFFESPSAFIDNNRSLAIPAAPRLYVHDNSGVLGRIRVSDGLVDVVGNMFTIMTDIAFSPDGELFGISSSALWRIDLVTANVEKIGDHDILAGNALVFASDGTLYGGGGFTDGLYELDVETGASTRLADMGHNSAGDLVFFQGNLYLASSNDQLVRIDLGAIGSGEDIGTVIGDIGYNEVYGLATASDGKMYGTAGTEVFEVDVTTGAGSTPGVSFEGQGMRRSNGSSFFQEAGSVSSPVFTSVLPNSRSVQTGEVASVFLSAIAGGNRTGIGCEPSLAPGFEGTFGYQVTDPATNQPIGEQNVSVDIPAGTARSFVLLIVPDEEISASNLEVLFGCQNTEIAEITRGINTLLLSAADTPPVDIVALGATASNDGIVSLDPVSQAAAFAVAAINLGTSASMTVTLDTGEANPLPLQYSVCETDPATSLCLAPPAASVSTQINTSETPTFGVFVSGDSFVFSPGVNRIYVRFRDSEGVVRGSTSVALRFGN